MKKSFSFIWHSIKGYRFHYFIMSIGAISDSFYTPVLYWSIKNIIDIIADNKDFSYNSLKVPFLTFVAINLIGHVIWRMSDIAKYFSEPFVKKNILTKFLSFNLKGDIIKFKKNNTSRLISRARGILDGHDAVWADMHHGLTYNLFATASHTISIILINRNIGFLILILNIIFFSFIYFFINFLHKRAEKYSTEKHNIFTEMSDKLINFISIKAFKNERKEIENFGNEISKKMIKSKQAFYRADIVIALISNFIHSIIIISVLIMSIIYKKQNLITIGDFSFIFTMLWDLMHHIQELTHQLLEFSSKTGDFESSIENFQIENDINFKSKFLLQNKSKYNIEVKNLSFKYPNKEENILNNINLTIKHGEKIAIVGYSGCGKSTFVHLISKLINHNNYENEIKISDNNGNIANNPSEIITIISQEMHLFHKTIFENIAYPSENITYKDIIPILKILNLYDFIESLPEKEKTIFGSNGISISSGQIQRILIARGILENKPILIFDESTSSIDNETEHKIYDYILTNFPEKTIIIVAHRITSIQKAKRIIVFDKNGQISQDGNQNDLIEQKGLYSQILRHDCC